MPMACHPLGNPFTADAQQLGRHDMSWDHANNEGDENEDMTQARQNDEHEIAVDKVIVNKVRSDSATCIFRFLERCPHKASWSRRAQSQKF